MDFVTSCGGPAEIHISVIMFLSEINQVSSDCASVGDNLWCDSNDMRVRITTMSLFRRIWVSAYFVLSIADTYFSVYNSEKQLS